MMEKAYTNQRERIAQEADFARQQRYADRVNLLRQYGWEHNHELDAFGFKESLWINVDDIRDQPDEGFAPTLAFAREGWEREQERLADEAEQAKAQKKADDDKR